MDKKRHPLARETPRHISSGSQNLARFSRPQQEVAVICPRGLDARLNSISAGIIAKKGSEDIDAQLMLFCTIYTNYNHKLLAKVRKLAIPWNKFKRLASRGGPKVFQEEKKGEDEVLVYICFGRKGLVLMLIMILGIFL